MYPALHNLYDLWQLVATGCSKFTLTEEVGENIENYIMWMAD